MLRRNSSRLYFLKDNLFFPLEKFGSRCRGHYPTMLNADDPSCCLFVIHPHLKTWMVTKQLQKVYISTLFNDSYLIVKCIESQEGSLKWREQEDSRMSHTFHFIQAADASSPTRSRSMIQCTRASPSSSIAALMYLLRYDAFSSIISTGAGYEWCSAKLGRRRSVEWITWRPKRTELKLPRFDAYLRQ